MQLPGRGDNITPEKINSRDRALKNFTKRCLCWITYIISWSCLNIDHIFRVELHVLTCVKSTLANR